MAADDDDFRALLLQAKLGLHDLHVLELEVAEDRDSFAGQARSEGGHIERGGLFAGSRIGA